jgi:hypothetical protein
MPSPVAGLAQSLIFGCAHFFGVTHLGVAFALGLLLTAIYEWRKTLITPILVHAAINFVAALGMALMMVAHANSPVMGIIGDPNDTECVIRRIAPNSAAEVAGLQIGDIITSFNTEPIRDFAGSCTNRPPLSTRGRHPGYSQQVRHCAGGHDSAPTTRRPVARMPDNMTVNRWKPIVSMPAQLIQRSERATHDPIELRRC